MWSRRASAPPEPNRLAVREAARRTQGGPRFDLTLSNPTHPDVNLSAPGDALAAALADPASAKYTPAPLGLPSARAAVAASYGDIVSPDAIAITASSSESYALLFKLLCDPGDVVLVPAPSYPLFDCLARLEGVTTRPYRLAYDGAWHIDWSAFDPEGARAVIAVNPNNPTGACLTESDLRRLDDTAAAHNQALIVDEVFADYVNTPARDAVRTVVGRPAKALTFALGGLSKSAGLPQLKLGWIAASGSASAVAHALVRLDFIADTYLSVGTPVQLALPRLLALGAPVRANINARVRRNRDALKAALGHASPCTLIPSEGGWSAVLRMPAVLTDEDWALRLLDEDDVLVQPGYFFDFDLAFDGAATAFLVVSLLPEPALFDAAVARVLARVAVLTA